MRGGIVMSLIELYIRWQVKRRIRAWRKLTEFHFYVNDEGVVQKDRRRE